MVFFRLCHKMFTSTFLPSPHPSISAHTMLTILNKGCNLSQNMISWNQNNLRKFIDGNVSKHTDTLSDSLLWWLPMHNCGSFRWISKREFLLLFFFKIFLKFYVNCQCCNHSFSKMCHGLLKGEGLGMGWEWSGHVISPSGWCSFFLFSSSFLMNSVSLRPC